MNVVKWILLAYLALCVILNITQIGKPRKPLEPSTVAAATVITGVVAWLVVIA